MGGGQAGYIHSDIAMPARKFLLFTVHAETALAERRLHRSVVELAARYPDWTRPDPNDPLLEHRFRQIPDYGDRVIRVVCLEDAHEIRIVTAFLDRRARKP